MEITVALFISLVGWLITYDLILKSQRKALSNQIQNEARIAISQELKKYKKLLIDISDEAGNLAMTPETVFEKNVKQKIITNYYKLLDKMESDDYLAILEEYEILFPETHEIIIDLKLRQKNIERMLEKTEKNQNQKVVVRDYYFAIKEQVQLIDELNKYYQNKILSAITGNKIPVREFDADSGMRLEKEDEKLVIRGKPK